MLFRSFFVSNDSLEKAYLAGVASVIQEEEAFVNEDNYSKAALEAVTYKDKLVAYPASFETSVLLYNETYLMEYLEKELQALKDVAIANGENIPELVMTEEQEAQYLQKKLEELIPSTIDDILSFANDYDAAENVESVFKWDVSDIFYNYFFVGNSLNVGGPNGDDPKQIDIYNEDSLKSLKVYQDLNQFFSIEIGRAHV